MKCNWMGHIMRGNGWLRDIIEGRIERIMGYERSQAKKEDNIF